MSKAKLTKTLVEAAKPQDRDYEIRDTLTPGFLLKVTPAGGKVFMLAHTTVQGRRRKPAIGRFGEMTVEQARAVARDWLADVRRGADPGGERMQHRRSPTVEDLCERFMREYSEPRNRPSTIRGNRQRIRGHINPKIGSMKVQDVTRPDIAHLIGAMQATPGAANLLLSLLRKIFNMAEVWGYRPDGSNPCRHVPRYPERARTTFITDDEMRRLFAYMNQAEREGLEHPFILLAIRLQFAFAARRSEILGLRWEWIDYDRKRVVWPDSKTGGMSKPLTREAIALFDRAPRLTGSPFVIPAIFDPKAPMPEHTYSGGWARILQRAGVRHYGTHAIRHRAATDIANSGVPAKIGMALTAHKTVAMFMRYVHPEDEAIRAAADQVADLRRDISQATPTQDREMTSLRRPALSLPPPKTAFGAYRPLRRAGKLRSTRNPSTGVAHG
ncbi:tyrosine-type recombinase/integrase [Brevundimonas sp. BAL450]|uniref:tyrosine-type recombinase/integrase n=1 Tax=Brevundimonas sp. BAL450 TaxID=1708162 RepID=UPI0018C9DD7B|nr:site-specific integrase [Brevundimonas sp. BAL450]MBG7615598.1 tyrosine-type recombinase/integrase [Brevundimonas sp. BAL450]